MPFTPLRPRAFAALLTTVGMAVLPAVCVLAGQVGPATRVVFYPYLPVEGVALFLAGVLLGALLGAEASLALRAAGAAPHSVLRLCAGCLAGGMLGLVLAGALAFGTAHGTTLQPSAAWLVLAGSIVVLCSVAGGMLLFAPARASRPRGALRRAELVALGLLALWALEPQFGAFPAHASLAQRDRWAREHVPQYAAMARVVAELPQLRNDLGTVRACAPTGEHQHRYARGMNGDDMVFTLDVEGDKGRGVLSLDCTIDGERVLDWRSARWSFAGRDVEVGAPP